MDVSMTNDLTPVVIQLRVSACAENLCRHFYIWKNFVIALGCVASKYR